MTSETKPIPGEPPKKKRTNGRGMKAKGDRGERLVAAHMAERLGMDIRRAPLSGGGVIHGLSGGADLSGTPGIHCEVKSVEALSFPAALAQAEASLLKSGAPDIPVVINRRNRQLTGQSYTLLRLDDFLDLYAAWLQAGRPRRASSA